MSAEKIVLTGDQVVEHLVDWVQNCDADDLARITGEIFGGHCFAGDEDNYHFYPDENYYGEFSELT